MRSFIGHIGFAVVGSAVILFLVASSPRLHAQLPASHVRTIPAARRAMVSRLLPDDEVVVITQGDGDIVLPDHEPTAREVIENAIDMGDVIVTVDVNEASGFLVDDGMWINTRVVGTVQQVLNSKTVPMRRGQQITAEYPGGEMKIGKVLVKAGNAIHRRRYLMFLEAEPPQKALGPTRMPFLIEKGKLVRPWPLESTPGNQDPLEGMTLRDIAKEARRFAK